MKIKFKSGMVIEIPLEEEIDAAEFDSKLSTVKAMVNYGLKQENLVSAFETSQSVEIKKQTCKPRKGRLDIEALSSKINEMRGKGISDSEISLSLEKDKHYVSALANYRPEIMKRNTWETKKIEALKGGEPNGSNNTTGEETRK